MYTLQWKIHLKNLAYKSELGLDSSDELTHFNNHDISDKNMTCADCIKNLWDDMARKTKNTKGITCTCEGLINGKKITGSKAFGVCKTFITSLTEYFFQHLVWVSHQLGKNVFLHNRKKKVN